jgi:hypothetical protein
MLKLNSALKYSIMSTGFQSQKVGIYYYTQGNISILAFVIIQEQGV